MAAPFSSRSAFLDRVTAVARRWVGEGLMSVAAGRDVGWELRPLRGCCDRRGKGAAADTALADPEHRIAGLPQLIDEFGPAAA